MPTPFGTAQYWHRNLNPKKLVDAKFSFKPNNQQMSAFVKVHKLPKETATEGLRRMNESDIPKVKNALNAHLDQHYKVHITFTENEIRHYFLPRDDVIFSYVVESDKGEVTDFISYYALNS